MFPTVPPPLPGVTHTDVMVRGHRWHVATAGDPGAPPLILLHGWPQHWWMWRHQIPDLARTHRVIAPDLRGFGWSDAPPGRYEKAGLASDVLTLADALGVERFDLVGHDWGGFVAFLTALLAPERVTRLVAFSIPHPWLRGVGSPKTGLVIAGYQVPLATPGLGPWLLRLRWPLKRLFRVASPAADWDRAALSLYADAQAQPGHGRAASAIYRTFLLREMVPLLRGRYADHRLPMPVLLATGSEELVITPDSIAGLERHAPRGTTAVVDGGGHFLPEEQPETVLRLIRQGLDTPV